MKRFLALTAVLALLFTCTAFAGTEEENLPGAALDTDLIRWADESMYADKAAYDREIRHDRRKRPEGQKTEGTE